MKLFMDHEENAIQVDSGEREVRFPDYPIYQKWMKPCSKGGNVGTATKKIMIGFL